MTDPSAHIGMEIPPDAEPIQQDARAKAYRPNDQLDRLADLAAAEPGALHRADVPLALRGLAAFHDTFRSAARDQTEEKP